MNRKETPLFEKRTAEAEALEQVITHVESQMTQTPPDSEEYATLMNRLERLYKLKEKHSPKRIDPNTWLIVGGNLAGILIVVAYEHAHVLPGKALSFAGKLR